MNSLSLNEFPILSVPIYRTQIHRIFAQCDFFSLISSGQFNLKQRFVLGIDFAELCEGVPN